MNLQEVAQAEQTIRGKLNRHVAAKAVAAKELDMHSAEIAVCLSQIAELQEHAKAALAACASLATGQGQPGAESEPPTPQIDYGPINASNAA